MKSRLGIGDHGPVSAQVLESLLAELLALAANTESSLMNQKKLHHLQANFKHDGQHLCEDG